MRVWLELHVDDEILARDATAWPEAARLVDAIARAAESVGGRLSIRFRARFAALDRHGFVRGLVARGHECGWHAHGARLSAARDAVVAAGGTAAVAAPGLVQTGLGGAASTLREAARLGARVVTDRLHVRPFGWRGRVPYVPVPGVLALDPSVDPTEWGVHRRAPDWDALAGLAARARARDDLALPFAPWFGATFHEHDLCAPGALRPRADALDGLRRFLERAGGAVPSAEIAEEAAPHAILAPFPSRAALLRRAVWPRIASAEAAVPPVTHRLSVGSRTVLATRSGPADGSARASVVVVHGGPDGRAQGLDFLGIDGAALPGLVVWTFTRTPSTFGRALPLGPLAPIGSAFRAPGNPVHVADTRAVIAAARAEGLPTGLLTWSAGLVNALLAVEDPRALPFLVDCEGPVDRWSLVPPCAPDHEWTTQSEHDDAHWARREALPRLRGLGARYLRVQGAPDHVHGPCDLHARAAIRASGGERLSVPGPLSRGGIAVRDAVVTWMWARVRPLTSLA